MTGETDDKIDLSLALPYAAQQAIAVHAVANGQTVDAAFEQMVKEGMCLLSVRDNVLAGLAAHEAFDAMPAEETTPVPAMTAQRLRWQAVLARADIPRSRNRREGRFVGHRHGNAVRSCLFRRVGSYTARIELAVRAALHLAERARRNGHRAQAGRWVARALTLIDRLAVKDAR